MPHDGIRGRLYEPPGPGRKPAVLIFGGSEGGEHRDLVARMFAVHGYPALSLAYFGAPGMPGHLADIPVEYGGRALRYLSRRPDVDPHRIVVSGASRGSELAELLGVHYPNLVHGVVALTPSNVALVGINPGHRPAWTWHGEPVPYTRTMNVPYPTDNPDAVIPVERIAGPVLATCGGNDMVWTSCPYGRALMARLDAHHDRYPHRLLNFPKADHLSNGLLPHVPQQYFDGLAAADNSAQVTEWAAVLTLLANLPRH